jgi:cation:H+ antiporter
MQHLFLYVGLALGGTAIAWWGSAILDRASGRLAAYYQLPAIVQGAVIAAVGSSFPELSSTVLATLVHGTFDLGVAAIVGSAVFNILVIPGVSRLVGRELASERTLVFKDAQFYITSVAVLLLTFALAVIYNPQVGEPLVGIVTRPVAFIPVALYGLYLFLQQQDAIEYDPEPVPEGLSPAREWRRLGLSLVVIVVGVEGLVRAAIGLGDWFGTPSFLWGVTVVAAGTSLPDAFVSVRAAQRGEGTVSLANVLGSNIFDLLVAVPAGILIAGAAPVDFAVAIPMMGFLTLATIILFAMLRTKMRLSRSEASILLMLYLVFLGWMILETAGILRVVT